MFADESQLPVLLSQALGMSKSMNLVDDKLLTGQHQETKEKERRRRRKSTLDRSSFPLYWKVRVNI